MTISNTDDPVAGPFEGDDSQTEFPFTFKVFATTDLDGGVVALIDDVQETLVLGSDYSVTLNSDQNANPGGTLTYPLSGSPLAAGNTLTIASNLTDTQPSSIPNRSGFYARVVENALDRNVMLLKQAKASLSRSLRFPLADFGVDTELPIAADRALKQLTFDADGNPVCTAPVAGTADALAADLLDNGAFNNGSGMMGHAAALNYVAGTIGWSLSTHFVNVKDAPFGADTLGAKGDGTTDDTVACQDAIDHAETLLSATGSIVNLTGIKVFFPEGEYLISASLRMSRTGLQLEGGTRKGSMIVTDTAGLVALIMGDDATLGATWFMGVSRLGFYARSGVANNTASIAIQAWNCIEPIFSELYICNFYTGMDCRRVYEGVFEKIFMDQRDRTNKGGYGILLKGISTGGSSVGCHLSDIEIRGNASTTSKWVSCVEVRHADGFYMNNCHLYQGDYALSFKPSGAADENYIEAYAISNCYFDQSTTACVLFGGSFAVGGAYQNVHFNNCYFRAAGIGSSGLFADNALKIAITSGPSNPFNFKFTGCTFRTAGESGVSVAGTSSGLLDVQELQFSNCTFSDNNRNNTATYSDMSLDCGNVTVVGNTFRAAANAATSCILHTGTAGAEEWKGLFANNNFASSNYTSKPITTSSTIGVNVSIYGNHHAGRGRHEHDTYKLATTNATATSIYSYAIGESQSVWVRARIHGFDQTGAIAASYDLEAHAARNGAGAAAFLGADPVVNRTVESAGAATAATVIDLSGNTVRVRATGIAATDIDWQASVEVFAS